MDSNKELPIYCNDICDCDGSCYIFNNGIVSREEQELAYLKIDYPMISDSIIKKMANEIRWARRGMILNRPTLEQAALEQRSLTN